MSSKRKIIVSVTNDISSDQRVEKICDYLESSNCEVILVGRKLKSSKEIERAYKILRFKLWFNKGVFFYLEYNFRLFFFLLFSKSQCYLANDVDTLPANYMASLFTKRPFLFDAHEAFSEVPELVNKTIKKGAWRWVEKRMIKRAKKSYTVSKGVANFYQALAGVKMEVVYNYPKLISQNDNPLIEFNKSKTNIIYQGAVNMARGIDLAIQSMNYVDATLHIFGDGDEYNNLKKLAQELNLLSKVIFYGRVLPEELRKITPQATIGISFEEDCGLNYRYAMPNKLFDYIMAEVPVLVSNLPEMKSLVQKSGVGEVLTTRNPEEVAKVMTHLVENKANYDSYRLSCIRAKREFCWENQKVVLDRIFNWSDICK